MEHDICQDFMHTNFIVFYDMKLFTLNKGVDCMRSESQKRADKKYIAKTYKRYAINTRIEYVPMIEKYMNEHNFSSSSSFFNSAVKYIIENDIDIKNE